MGGFVLTSRQAEARGPGLYTLDGLLCSPGLSFPVRMTMVQHGKALLLISSFPPTTEVLALLRPLGAPKLILAPNAAHCLWGARMRDVFPGSVLAAPPIAERRFPGIRWDAIVRGPQDLAALLDRQGLDSGDVLCWCTQDVNPWLQEIVLLHRPSRTLILTDLAFNFKRGGETPLPGGLVGWLLRNTYLSLAGGYRGCCPTTSMGWLVKDADAMAAMADDMLGQDFDQVVVAHGDVVAGPRGKQAFQRGAAAFFHDVAERRRQRARAGPWLGGAAVVAAGTAVALGALWWRYRQ